MNFADTPLEAAFRAEARAFVEEYAPRFASKSAQGSEDWLATDSVTRAKAWQACKQEHGWACLTWPRLYGGRGGSRIESLIFGQEESRYDTPPDLFTVGTGFMGPAIIVHGSEAQKDRYLLKIARGDEIWCQLFSEPAAGSDLAGLRTTARRDGDAWRIDGQKNWTTAAHIADFGVIVTRTDPDVSKHAGLTCFIVDMRAPGLEIRPIRQMDGASDFSEVFLTDVRVPDARRLGAVGDGWAVAVTILMNERHTLGGGEAVRPEALLELAERCDAAADQDVRQRIADFYARAAGLRYTAYRTITALSRGQTPGPESSIGKLVSSSLQQEIASFAVDLQGAPGLAMDEEEWQARFLAAPGMRIAGGTDEVLRNIIAERVLRLPPEPRLDKDVPFRDVPTAPPHG